jgi:hypothetical protein
LQLLHLSNNEIEDIGPLRELVNLESLTLYHNEIEDMSLIEFRNVPAVSQRHWTRAILFINLSWSTTKHGVSKSCLRMMQPLL